MLAKYFCRSILLLLYRNRNIIIIKNNSINNFIPADRKRLMDRANWSVGRDGKRRRLSASKDGESKTAKPKYVCGKSCSVKTSHVVVPNSFPSLKCSDSLKICCNFNCYKFYLISC